MEKQNRSALLTLTLVYIFGVCLILLAFTAPALMRQYIQVTHCPESLFLPVTTTFYAILPFAAATLLALDRLLRRILRGDIYRAEARAARGERHGERAADRAQFAGERKLAEKYRVLRGRVDLARRSKNG